jgi:hypothetical protein
MMDTQLICWTIRNTCRSSSWPCSWPLAQRTSRRGWPRLTEDDGLHEIRAEMPTEDDVWEVEKVVQYRSYYRKGQWLIKWKNYPEARNTWEPWD